MLNLIALHICLKYLGKTMDDLVATYENLPFVNLKTKVSDKRKFKPNKNESRLVEPKEVQDKIDGLLKEGERMFCRPSGTEDILRIYAEAETSDRVSELANALLEIVKAI